MKKILIITNLLTASALIWFLVYGNKSSGNSTGTDCNTCTNICSDYSVINKGITKYDVAVLDSISKYYKHSAAPDASSNIWFSLDTLKRFIWNIENGVCGIKCSKELQSNHELGIRIYFAKYPAVVGSASGFRDLQNVNTLFAKQQTLFMIPTYDSIITTSPRNVKHIDFDPSNRTTFDYKRCAFQKIDLSSGFVMALGGLAPPPPPPSGTPGQNHGGLCPPVCDGGEAF